MDYKRYAIVVIPPPEIVEQASRLSRVLESLGTFFVLDGVTCHPHLSLYRVPFDESMLPSVIAALRNIAAMTEPFTLQQETYYPAQGVWVGVRYVADKAILDLHTTVIAATREQRVLEEDTRYKARWTELSPAQHSNIEYCGWVHSFMLYSPHLSFAKLKQPQRGVLASIPQLDLSFRADRIGLYEVGEYGACAQLVADFRLTG